jgi:hypothetical protein
VDERVPRDEEYVVEGQRGVGANAVRKVSHPSS